MKVKFCCLGWSAPYLLNATSLMVPIRKVANVCFNDYDWLHHNVEDDKV